MAYAVELAKRMKEHLAAIKDLNGLEEKKMFGGVAFMIRGNMACGVHADYMIVRVGPQNYQAALQQPFTRPFDMSGRPMAGWVEVSQPGCAQDGDLQAWIKKAIDFSNSLPSK